jgi:ABC-2 type transport system permease protein
MSQRPFRALVRKDLQLFAGDRRAMILAFVAPLALASFMALVMGGASDGGPAGKITIIVADEDGSPLAARVVAGLKSEAGLDVRTAAPADARQAVLKGKATAAVVLPDGFGKAAGRALFGADAKPELTLLRDPSHSAEAGMIRGMLMQHVMRAVTENSFSGPEAASGLKEAIAELDGAAGMPTEDRKLLRDALEGFLKFQDREQATRSQGGSTDSANRMRGGLTAPFETKEEVVTAGRQTSRTAMYAHAFAGMAVQFVLFGAIEAGVGLLTERQRGLWKRLRAAPLAKAVLIAAKMASGAIIALLTTAVVLGFGMLVFGLRVRGSVIGLTLVAGAYALTASAFGLLVAALGKTPQAARGVSILAVLLMVMLGGAWMPTFIFPQWLQSVTTVIPTRWAVDGFDGNLFRDFSVVESLKPTVALLGFAVLFGTVALARFRWDEG